MKYDNIRKFGNTQRIDYIDDWKVYQDLSFLEIMFYYHISNWLQPLFFVHYRYIL